MKKATTYALHTERVCLNAVGERSKAIAAFVCDAFTPAEDPTMLSLTLAGEGPFILSHDSVRETYANEDLATEALMRAMTQKISHNYTHGLALHAAALESEAGVLLFPAPVGSGKTRLAVELASRVLRCLSDELVFVPNSSTNVCAWAQPVHIGAHNPILAEIHSAHLATHGDLYSSASFGGARDSAKARPIRAIVTLDATPGASAQLTKMSPAETGAVVTSALLNAKKLDAIGAPAVLALAKAVEGYRLRYSTPKDALRQLSDAALQLAARH